MNWGARVFIRSIATSWSLACSGKASPSTHNGTAGAIFFGCSSVTSQDPAVGASAYADLCRKHLAQPQMRTRPLAAYDCSLSQLAAEPVKIPKLLRAYLTLGARICGPPALDRQFKTIDFLTLLDLETMPLLARQKFLGA